MRPLVDRYLGDLSDWSIPMLKKNAQLGDVNEGRMELSEADKELIGLVAFGLTDAEIAAQLQVPKHIVLDYIARLLAKLGARERLEIVLYAFSEPTMYQRIIAEIANRNRKNLQAQTPGAKQNAS
jgi:DNA-binding CsgD family transcriptional regulator